jgi:quercetin dioxygenase-like cupin family protein
MRKLLVMLVLVPFLLGGALALAQSGHVMLGPDEMKWVDAPPSLPRGATLVVIEGKPAEPGPFTMRLKFPAGYKVPAHSHPAIEHVTVLSGTINFAMGDKFDAGKFKPMRAGSFIVMPVGINHFVETKEETVIQLHGVGPWDVKYVNPEDDPRKK